jgi:hypothetical protein
VASRPPQRRSSKSARFWGSPTTSKKCIQKYATIAAPVTELKLYTHNDQVDIQRTTSKGIRSHQALVKAQGLALMDFTDLGDIKIITDASITGTGGEVLIQNGRPVAFESKNSQTQRKTGQPQSRRWAGVHSLHVWICSLELNSKSTRTTTVSEPQNATKPFTQTSAFVRVSPAFRIQVELQQGNRQRSRLSLTSPILSHVPTRQSLAMPSRSKVQHAAEPWKHGRHNRSQNRRPCNLLESVSLATNDTHSPPGPTAISIGSRVCHRQNKEQCRSNLLNRTTRPLTSPMWRSICQTGTSATLGSLIPQTQQHSHANGVWAKCCSARRSRSQTRHPNRDELSGLPRLPLARHI